MGINEHVTDFCHMIHAVLVFTYFSSLPGEVTSQQGAEPVAGPDLYRADLNPLHSLVLFHDWISFCSSECSGTPCEHTVSAFQGLISMVKIWVPFLCPSLYFLGYGSEDRLLGIFANRQIKLRPLKLLAYVGLGGCAGSDGRWTKCVTLPSQAWAVISIQQGCEFCTNQPFKAFKRTAECLSWLKRL